MYVCLCMYVCTYLYHSRYYNLDPSALRSVQHTHQQYPSICSHIVHCALSSIHTISIPVYAHILFTAFCPTYTPAVSQYMLKYCSLRSVQHTHQQYPSICSNIVHCALSSIHTSSIPVYAHILFTALCPTYTPAISQYMLTYCSLRSVEHTHQQYPSICSHIVHGALSNIHTSSIPVYAHILFTALCPTYTPAVSQYMLTYYSRRSVQHTHQQYPTICSHIFHCALSSIHTSSIPVFAHIHVLSNSRIFLLSSL